MKTVTKLFVILLLLSCQDEVSTIVCFPAPDQNVLLVNQGPIEVDGCGWQFQFDEHNYFAVDVPDQMKINNLNIFTPIELLTDSFTCFGGTKFRHAQLAHDCSQLLKVYWGETQCSDPWQRNSENDLETLRSMMNYLQDNEIEVFAAKINEGEEGMNYCAACSCPSGRTIELFIDESDMSKASDLGFYQPCNFEDATEEIAWLKQLKQSFEQSGRPAGSQIIQYEYKGQCVFLVEDCYQCADALTVVYDAEQNVVCEFGGIDGRSTCPDFYENASNKQILYSNIGQ